MKEASHIRSPRRPLIVKSDGTRKIVPSKTAGRVFADITELGSKITEPYMRTDLDNKISALVNKYAKS